MKFAKVMFLQVSVCPQGGLCMTGGVCECLGGACVVKGGMCGEGGECVVKGGHSWQRAGMCGKEGMCMAKEGMCGKGVCVVKGCVWQRGHAW